MACLKGSAHDHLLDFFLCVFFAFFLPPEWCFDDLRLPGMTTFLVLAPCMFGFGARAPMGTFPRQMLTAHTSLWWFLGKRGKPTALRKVSLQLLTRHGYGVKACPTHEARMVMRANNVVEVHWIILDGIHAEWATWDPWPVPILGFVRQEDRNTHKCMSQMQFLQ